MLNARLMLQRRRSPSGGGSAGVTATLSNVTVIGEVDFDDYAGFQLTNDGHVDYTGTASPASEYDWKLSGVVADFEARATVVSGSVTSGSAPTGTWLPLSTSQLWKKYKALNVGSVTLTVEIRRTADFVIVDSATVVLEFYGAGDPYSTL